MTPRLPLHALSLISVLLSCSLTNKGVKILGITDGFKDSTLIILKSSEGSEIGKTYIVANKYTFILPKDNPQKYSLETGFRKGEKYEFVDFWAEGKNLSIYSKKGELNISQIRGGKLQKEYFDLQSAKNPFQCQADSLDNIISNSNPSDTNQLGNFI